MQSLNTYNYVEQLYMKPRNFEVTISDEDKIITIEEDGSLLAELSLNLVGGILSLIGKDNMEIGSVEIPSAQTIQRGYYDKATQEIVLEIGMDDTTNSEIRIDVQDLVEAYQNGNGIEIDDEKRINIKINQDSTEILDATEDGLAINLTNYVTSEQLKEESTIREQVDNQQWDTINTINNNLVQSIDAINKNMADGFNTINGGIDNEIRPAIEENRNNIASLEEKIKDIDVTELKEDIKKNAEDIATVNTNLVQSIDTINKNMMDGFNTINGGIDNEIRPELEKAVKYVDVADENLPERKAIVLKNGDLILGGNLEGDNSSLVQLNRWGIADFGSASVKFNINTPKDVRPTVQEAGQSGEEAHQIAYLSDIVEMGDGKISTVELIQDTENNLHYILMVDGVNKGDINIPKDQFLKKVDYDSNTKELIFVFETSEGDKETKVNIGDLIDTYIAGNGIELTDNVFSIKVKDGDKFLGVASDGLTCNFSFDKQGPWTYNFRDKNGTIVSQIDFDAQYDQISEVLVNLQQSKATRTELQAEVTARGEADTQLQNDLANEATTARAAEKANADAIIAETTRAEGIEAKLRTDVDYCGQRIDEDLENTSKALEYKVQWDSSKSKIVLPSGGQLVGTKYGTDGSNPEDGAVIAQLNEWDVMDFGSTKYALNLNVPSGIRPTVQEAGQSGSEANKIAYLSDIETASGDNTEAINNLKKELIGTSTDLATADTINGVRTYVNTVTSGITDGIEGKIDEKVNPLESKFAEYSKTEDITIELNRVLTEAKEYTDSELTSKLDNLNLDVENKISTAVSDAKQELDNHISANTNDIQKLSTVLNESGEYEDNVNHGTGIVDHLHVIVHKLINGIDEGNITSISDIIDNELGDKLNAKADTTELQAEVTARGEADTQIQNDLQTEATTARAAEKANADAIIAEKERAEGIEAKLRTDVDYCGQRIDEDLENTSKALEYKVQWDSSKSKIVLPSGGQLVGTKYGTDGSNPEDGAVIAQLNEWDVMDFGSTKYALNLNVPSGIRPTVQEAGQSGSEANKIAYLSDIEAANTEIATLKSTIEALTARIEALENK